MGIPAYFSYLIKNYKSIIGNLNNLNKNIDHFYLDSNSIIYDAINSIEYETNNYEEKVILYVCEKIEYYINTIKPNKSVYIAFDGVAPVAKLEQQRTRRYKSQFTEKINKEIKPEYKKSFDRCSVTPGTNFMNKLCKKVKDYFNKPDKYKLNNIFLSCSDEPGEGEHKIFQHIRKYPSNETSVIYGLDADLIMLTINHLKHNSNLYLFRETPEFIKSIDKTLNPNELYILDIPSLKNIINQYFSNNHDKDMCSNYIFICFLLGNDFLPHFPALNIRSNGIKNINNCFLSSDIEYLIENNNLNWDKIKKFITELSSNEEDYIIEEYAIRSKFKKRHFNKDDPKYLEDRLNNLPILDMKVEEFINPYKKDWQHRYYHELFHINYDKHLIKDICINYLEGLEWTFKYYNSGCPDWHWYYKYHYPPLLEDLVKYIPSFNITLIEEKPYSPIHEYTQLSYVLPKTSLYLLPTKIQKFLTQNYEHLYYENFKIIWHFCRYFWESHIDLPHIDIQLLDKLIQSKI